MIGAPIGHSCSPVLHLAAYRELGLDWSYAAIEVDEAALPRFLDALGPQWSGLSLTMPLKRAVLPLLDEVDEVAARAGAVNTVLLGPDGRRGFNTDVGGVAAAVQERYDGPVGSAVILGAGATAASAVLGLADLGCVSFTLCARNPERSEDTLTAAARHPAGVEVDVLPIDTIAAGSAAPPADIVVSTIPASAQSVELVAGLRGTRVVFDVVYDPWPTPLAASVSPGDGRVLVTGLDLLVHQAAAQVELMTGRAAPLSAMRAALSG